MSAQGLPAHILALFTPRPPPQHLPPQVDKHPVKLTGCADFVEYFSTESPPKPEPWESPLERKARRHNEKMEAHKEEMKKFMDKYDPHKDPNASGDPFKTLFVARISYDTTEKKIKREFEVFGSIKRVRMIYDHKGKPRGYAFIEYEHERDLKNSYKQGDGKKIDGRRVMVDVERGRTVEGWLPRRLGGGRGPGRQGKPSKKKKKMMDAQKEREKEEEGGKDRKRDRSRSRDRRGGGGGGGGGGDEDRKRDRGEDRERPRDRDRDRDRKRGGDDEDRGGDRDRKKSRRD